MTDNPIEVNMDTNDNAIIMMMFGKMGEALEMLADLCEVMTERLDNLEDLLEKHLKGEC